MPITLILAGGGGGGAPSGTIPWANPVSLNMGNSPGTIDLSLYSTVSFRITNPGTITLTNGTNGYWYSFVILSDGEYGFTNEVVFAYNNLAPTPSINGRVDAYSIQCVNTNQGTKYLATYGFDYSTISI